MAIVLTGYMGSGKTSVGRLLSQRLSYGFLDLDDVITAKTGKTIAGLFETLGEEGFRKRERELLEPLLERPALVVATGGGALALAPDMHQALRQARVVYLRASPAVLWSRVSSDPGRPLVAQGRQAFEARYEERRPTYELAHWHCDTSENTVEQVVGQLEAWLRLSPTEGFRLEQALSRLPGQEQEPDVHLPLGDRSYRVAFEPGGRHRLGEVLRGLAPKARKCAVVTNPVVGPLYYDHLATALASSGFEPCRIDIPDGEEAKQLRQIEALLEELVAARLERRDLLMALGGGVVGDVTGFASSVYLRGVSFVQVPTTLLSLVDSSIGGKTGVNSARGKNLFGTFCQPLHVLADVQVLSTLPDVEYSAGLAEVVKYGAIRDVAFLDYLEAQTDAILARQQEALEIIVRRSCLNKAVVVVADEREQGERALLNFGHTLGHAFETLGAYQGLRHGEAVSIGMVFAAQLSERLGLCASGVSCRLERLLRAFRLPVAPPPGTVDQCLEIMALDKKVSDGAIRFVLLEAIGRARLVPLRPADIRPALEAFMEVRP